VVEEYFTKEMEKNLVQHRIWGTSWKLVKRIF
jgi:hypothetical protein